MPRPYPDAVLGVSAESSASASVGRNPLPWALLPCLKCGEAGGVSVNLATFEFSCAECEEETSFADARAKVAVWAKLLGWLSTSPGCAEG